MTEGIEEIIRAKARSRAVDLTLHAQQEMAEEDISPAELLNALENCVLLEDYPDHKRGPCCLVCGLADTGRYLHAVCATEHPKLVIVTTYEPKPPKWETPFKRGSKQ